MAVLKSSFGGKRGARKGRGWYIKLRQNRRLKRKQWYRYQARNTGLIISRRMVNRHNLRGYYRQFKINFHILKSRIAYLKFRERANDNLVQEKRLAIEYRKLLPFVNKLIIGLKKMQEAKKAGEEMEYNKAA